MEGSLRFRILNEIVLGVNLGIRFFLKISEVYNYF